ncbi:MAG: hypothetical protein GX620_03170 [Chloroflexi bacterium]|nr:hypothetical protein [Chloroflexota bacterium]
MRILTSGANGDKQVYSYGRVKTEDANGNVLTRVEKGTTHTHVYDEENWQKSVTVGGTTTRYYYAGGACHLSADNGPRVLTHMGHGFSPKVVQWAFTQSGPRVT